MSKALDDIATERARQIDVEGWTIEHDDLHNTGKMARAAGVYAFHAGTGGVEKRIHDEGQPPYGWPWDASWWKPRDRRRDLVRAGALIVAEIERLDRIADRSATAEAT